MRVIKQINAQRKMYLRQSQELRFKRRHDGWIRGSHHGYRFR